ncbi:DNA-binding response regulator [candidate division WWE3 bacterium RIFOXYC1_FULL_39_7]|uniref:DNA-binding response regulator n=2 Tax=Katanobacteria TaxID=422282 RepID=A0A1F4X9G8_UNCKA|nr:MAG: DNA-binding response regulator [candidate division WWE3 bacterium RIFOXYC1_FULL_39_7]OGC78350.1 MAG: DNA-binding response regulator [candidate division WWE3 bacterium RIFOXYD1_FULL_39_9]
MRILIVEDEPKIAKSIKKGLEQEAFSVDIAENGTLGHDLASSETFDLIILDLMLPEMDGLEICRQLRKNGISTPILMLTAKSELDDKVLGLNTGADDYLVKPFAFEELLARIKALLRRPEKSLDATLECSNLKIDTISYKVTRDNTPILLSRREFALLEYLVRNKNRTLSKESITAHVWDYDSEILPNTVEQYMGYLRNKVDKKFSNFKPLIKTIRGFGYMISDDNV